MEYFSLVLTKLPFILQQEQYGGMKEVFRKTLYLLKLLAKENNAVQTHIFDRLDVLLDVRVAESDLAIALKEVSVMSFAF